MLTLCVCNRQSALPYASGHVSTLWNTMCRSFYVFLVSSVGFPGKDEHILLKSRVGRVGGITALDVPPLDILKDLKAWSPENMSTKLEEQISTKCMAMSMTFWCQKIIDIDQEKTAGNPRSIISSSSGKIIVFDYVSWLHTLDSSPSDSHWADRGSPTGTGAGL